MKKALVYSLTETFEGHAQETEGGVEFWPARDLQHLPDYSEWRTFALVIGKAKTACEMAEHTIADHFVEIDKMVAPGSGSQREVDDIMLTRYACYLIDRNGDPGKSEITFARTCLAIQARRAELIERRLQEVERLAARQKLTQTEKDLSQVIYEQTGENRNFGLIRGKGDRALFGKSTQTMKSRWKVPANRPLADFAPPIVLKAKDFATEITIFNAKERPTRTKPDISREYVTNNEAVRKTLPERGIRPEALPPDEDIKRMERRLKSQRKKSLQNPDGIDT